MTKTLLAAAIAATFISSVVDAAPHRNQHRVSHVSRGGAAIRSVVPSGSVAVLYDQFTGATTNGIDSEQSSYSSYDDEGADDFVVPASGWTVQQFNFQGIATDGTNNFNTWSPTVNVFVYPDASGMPGVAPVCTYTGIAETYNATNTVISVALTTPCVLAAGTYWVGMQAVNAFADTGLAGYFWTGSAPVAHSPAVWENPGDTFQTGCTSFTAVTSCGGTDPDFAFQVLGSVTTPVRLQDFGVD